MPHEQETFLGGIVSQSDPIVFQAAERWFTDLSLRDRMRELETLFLDAAKRYDDDRCCKYLQLMRRTHEARVKELRENWFRARTRLSDALFRDDPYLGRILARRWMRLYGQIPDCKRRMAERDRYQDEHYVQEPTLLKTKAVLLGQTVRLWEPEATRESVDAFWFFSAAFRPLRKDASKYLRYEEPARLTASRGRFVSDAERAAIEGILLNHTSRWEPEAFIPWLDLASSNPHRYGQTSFEDVLVKLWRARCDDAKMAEYLRAWRFAQPFGLGRRSKAAMALHEQACAKIVAFDTAVVTLVGNMKSGSSYGSEKIGMSEFVRGEIDFEFPLATYVKLVVTIPTDDPEPLGRDVTGRARRHIQKWLEDPENQAYRVQLDVLGIAGLELTEQFAAKTT